MLWVDKMKTTIPELKSSNWIAQETRSQAANGNKLEICNFQDLIMCLLQYQKLMKSAKQPQPPPPQQQQQQQRRRRQQQQAEKQQIIMI